MITGCRSRFRNLQKEGGVSLLELLLVVGIGGVSVMGLSYMAQDWRETARNESIARHLSTVHAAAETYVQANFADIWANPAGFAENTLDVNGDGEVNEMDPLNNPLPYIVIPLDDDGASPWFLKDSSGALSPGFPDKNAFNQSIRVLAREAGYVQGKRAIDVITIAQADALDPDARPLPEERLQDIARFVGDKGGVFSAINVVGDVCTDGEIKSVYGGWTFQAADLTGGGLCDGVVAPQVGIGGYVAAVGTVFYQDAMKSDVLYKVAIPGRPELNRMEANLDMNNLDIQGVRYLTADNLRVEGNLVADTASVTIDGVLRAQGARNVVNVALDGGAGDPCRFTDPLSGAATLDPAATGPCTASGGYLVINGRNLSGTTAPLNVENVLIPATNSNPAAQNLLMAGDVIASQFGTGTVTADTVQTNTLTGINALQITANTLSLSGNASVSNLTVMATPGTANTVDSFTADHLEIGMLESKAVSVQELKTNTLNASGKVLVGGDIPNYFVDTMASCASDVAYNDLGELVFVSSYDCTP